MGTILPRLCLSSNRRFIVNEEGYPFFWLGDTAWELFHRLDRKEAKLYFVNRQLKRFNVVQAVILAELDGLNTPNAYGERQLHDNDPEKPNEAYFHLIDEYLTLAANHEIYVALLPTWGDKVMQLWGVGPVIFSDRSAFSFGKFLGERYKDRSNLIWVLGGDRPAAS